MSLATLSVTMPEMKPDDIGANTNSTWQNYRVPLPAPSTRAPLSYIPHPPPTAPANLMYNGGPPETYSSISPPQHDVQARRGREAFGLQGNSRDTSVLSTHRSYPSLKRNFGTFEENLYARPTTFMHESSHDTEQPSKPSIQSDHRLLSFLPIPLRQTVVDQYNTPAKIDVAAQIHGMFFLSEMSTQAGDVLITQPELTCYRRNLFQISGSVTASSGSLSVITEQGKTVPVVSQELAISAIESVDGHVIRLIVIPWKTPPANAPEIPTGAEQEPAPIPLTFESSENEDKTTSTVSQQISWRRLQFRVATANNGRRKELQQHFILRLKVMATLEDGTKVCLSESNTAPIVVRGRSPRNFQTRREIPLVGSSASPRGQITQVSPSVTKRLSHGAENVGVGTAGMMDMPKRPYHFGENKFPASQSPVANGYQQWNSAVQHSEHNTGNNTPTFSPSSSSMPPYMSSMHTIQPLQQTASQPPIATQAPPYEPPRHYYSPPTTMPPQYDPGYRAAKSPRLSNVPSSSMYQSFEAAYATDLPPNASSRGAYYSPAPASGTWTSPDHVASYTQALQPQPIQSSHATQSIPNIQHPQQRRSQDSQPPPPAPHSHTDMQAAPQQHAMPPNYNYNQQDNYQTNLKDEGPNLSGYGWSPAGQ